MEKLIYKVQREDGDFVRFFRREDALRYYADNECIGLSSYTKDLFPKVHVILDGAGFDPFNLTEEDTMKSTTNPERKAIRKYDEANTTQVKLKLNINTDKDIIEYLEQSGNKQGLIKDLIRERMAKEMQSA